MKIKIIFVLLLMALGQSAVWAQSQQPRWVTSKELIKDARALDGEAVIFVGEVVGDVMRRGRFAWINVQDDYGTIGVWAPIDLINEITYLGDYDHKGDTITVEGRFSRADYQLNGELCIRAADIRSIFPGLVVFHQLGFLKKKMALTFLILTGLLMGLRFIILREQKRRA